MRHKVIETSKINRTAQQFEALKDIKAEILRLTGLSDDVYTGLCFEIGCLFAECFCGGDVELKKKIMREPATAYWDWWRMRWKLDDENILKDNTLLSSWQYELAKKCMVDDAYLEYQLNNWLHLKGVM